MIENQTTTGIKEVDVANRQENIYTVSTANILSKATLYATLWSIGTHGDIAQRTGFDGIELWSASFTPRLQIKTGHINQNERDAIIAGHQSPRKKGLLQMRSHEGDTLIALQAMVILPEMNQSLKDLEKVHDLVGGMPIVMYHETPVSYHQTTHIKERLIQPEANVCADWQVQTAEDFLEALDNHGFSGVCLDLFHLRQPGCLPNWREAIPVLLPRTNEIQIAVGRTDQPGNDPQATVNELADLMNGTEQTELPAILRSIYEAGWHGRVVVELLPDAIKQVLETESFLLPKRDLENTYERIRSNLAKLLG